MYEASGFFAVTSANSAFSALVPVASICASCKRALRCSSDGCDAAAVHSLCSSCEKICGGARGDRGVAPDGLIGQCHTEECVGACTLRARVRACVRKLLCF